MFPLRNVTLMSFVLLTLRDVQSAENDAAILPGMIGLTKLTSKILQTRVIVDSEARHYQSNNQFSWPKLPAWPRGALSKIECRKWFAAFRFVARLSAIFRSAHVCKRLPIEKNQNAFAACTHLMTRVKWNLSDFRYLKHGRVDASCFEEFLAAVF